VKWPPARIPARGLGGGAARATPWSGVTALWSGDPARAAFHASGATATAACPQ